MKYHVTKLGNVYATDPSQGVPDGCQPVAVIAYEDREQVERLAAAYADSTFGSVDWDLRAQRDREKVIFDLQAALREYATPKPPKPDEPTDPAVRVKADGCEWAKVGHWWVTPATGETPREWGYLVEMDDFAVVDQ